MKKFLQKLFGINEVLEKLDEIEKLLETENEWTKTPEAEILKFLKVPRSTYDVAKYFKKSRSWASLILNKMEREGKIKEVGYKKRKLLYKTL